jgi:riboflavin synthase
MFTGLIQAQGTLLTVEDPSPHNRSWWVQVPASLLATLNVGDSLALNGCCTTVVQIALQQQAVQVHLGPETLACTTFGTTLAGAPLNLEAPLSLGAPLGGHLVSGHVDGLATLEALHPEGDCWRLQFALSEALAPQAPLLVPKGSITLNGISLTLNEVEGPRFGVCIIPHTWQVTNLHQLAVGHAVHVELDLLGKYVQRLMQPYLPAFA